MWKHLLFISILKCIHKLSVAIVPGKRWNSSGTLRVNKLNHVKSFMCSFLLDNLRQFTAYRFQMNGWPLIKNAATIQVLILEPWYQYLFWKCKYSLKQHILHFWSLVVNCSIHWCIRYAKEHASVQFDRYNFIATSCYYFCQYETTQFGHFMHLSRMQKTCRESARECTRIMRNLSKSFLTFEKNYYQIDQRCFQMFL